MKMNRLPLLLLGLAILIILGACNSSDVPQSNDGTNEEEGVETSGEASEATEEVNVTLQNSDGEEVGEATLTQQIEGVNVDLEGWNLPPGKHAFHIHEKGVCDPPDFESAGGHFNPTDAKHGFDNPEGPHAGDMPNIEVAEDGTVDVSYLNERVTLEKGEANSLLGDDGTSLVIHSGADDYESQPAGDAGERIACGVIGE